MADLTSGLDTSPQLDADPPHLQVRWIAWNSPFRGSGLAVGDRIVGVAGQPLESPANAQALSRLLPTLPGQYAEGQAWEALRMVAGSPLTLRVRRRALPVGWVELDVTAPLVARGELRDEQGRPVLGAGGPLAMDNDDFETGSWQGWYDNVLLKPLGRALDPEQRGDTFVTRSEGRALREPNEQRVAHALAHYTGPWVEALKADWNAALAVCDGTSVTLPADGLDFRRRGEELAADVRAQAQAVWTAFLAARAADTRAAFPAPNPVRTDLGALAGQVVVLPALGNADWIADAGHGWFAAGTGNDADGWYFLDAEAEPAEAMLRAQARYARLVDPNIAASWSFVARITGDARLVVVGDGAHYGLVAEPLAALVGDAMFVDLTQRRGAQAPFAGEAALTDDAPVLPADDATPAQVLGALVGAVKAADIALWRALHASWWVETRSVSDRQGNDETRLVVHPGGQKPDDSMFELSLRSMKERVLDARVTWTDTPREVLDGSRFEGASTITEVQALLEHVGSFDGQARTFADVTVRTRWTLQRVGNGPWRVTTCQPI